MNQRAWKLIHRHIDELPTFENQPDRTTSLGNGGQILTGQLKPGLRGERFSPYHLSDTFFALCSWHKNEQNNLKDKLAKALANTSKHVKKAARTANFVFLRLHHTADLNLIEKHAREILDDKSRPSPLDGVILYQVAVTRTGDNSQVSHHVRTVVANNYVDEGRLVGFAALIGVPSPNASRLELRSADGTSKPIGARYMFQAGDHYFLAPPISENLTFTISSVAPGLRAHAVIAGTPGMTLSGIFPSDDELLIL